MWMVILLGKSYVFFVKSLVCVILFLLLGIFCKLNSEFKNNVESKIYHEYWDFSVVKVFYDKYFGSVFPIENIYNLDLISVFNDELIYHSVEDYGDGAVVKVNYNYLVPVINEGIVVYIGEKDKYGNVVIVEGDNGIDIWYGNLCNVMVKMYDFVSSGSYLGESCDDKIYLVYTKKNQFLDYRDYLK